MLAGFPAAPQRSGGHGGPARAGLQDGPKTLEEGLRGAKTNQEEDVRAAVKKGRSSRLTGLSAATLTTWRKTETLNWPPGSARRTSGWC